MWNIIVDLLETIKPIKLERPLNWTGFLKTKGKEMIHGMAEKAFLEHHKNHEHDLA